MLYIHTLHCADRGGVAVRIIKTNFIYLFVPSTTRCQRRALETRQRRRHANGDDDDYSADIICAEC